MQKSKNDPPRYMVFSPRRLILEKKRDSPSGGKTPVTAMSITAIWECDIRHNYLCAQEKLLKMGLVIRPSRTKNLQSKLRARWWANVSPAATAFEMDPPCSKSSSSLRTPSHELTHRTCGRRPKAQALQVRPLPRNILSLHCPTPHLPPAVANVQNTCAHSIP